MPVDHQDLSHVITFHGGGAAPTLCPAAQRAVDWALERAERHCDPATGVVLDEWHGRPSGHATLKAGLGYLLKGDFERGKALLRLSEAHDSVFNTPILVLMLKQLGPILDDDVRDFILGSLRTINTVGAEDIIAGRNNNIPLLGWSTRIAQGVLFDIPAQVEAGRSALERLTDLVAAHGTIPEFNSPTYNVVTLSSLRATVLLGEPATSALAARLERHLWQEMAWRYHPKLRSLCGPWGRAYHDSLVGASGLVPLMLHIAWDALFDPSVAYDWKHAHDTLHGTVFPLLLQDLPFDYADVALEKHYPLAVTASAEQVQRKLGDEAHRTWVPGGIAELTTWMDEDLAVGTSTRVHVHGMQSVTYLAQWTRTGQRVERLQDLGHAFTRLAINGRRPGDPASTYHYHHDGQHMTLNECLWGDDGRPFVLQSGPTALVLYLPKAQERWNIRSMEMLMALPRLDTIDAVLVDGAPVDEHEGPAGPSVVVRSGSAALGLRFAVCDPELVEPRLFVERTRDHLLVGLRLVDFGAERVIPDDTYLRHAGSIGAELRYAPEDADVAALVHDMREAELSDTWEMARFGGPREASFRVGGARLYGRFDPIGECWLRRIVPPHPGRTVAMALE